MDMTTAGILHSAPVLPIHREVPQHLNHQNTLPRGLAHKRRLENVLVTSLSTLDPHRNDFLFGAYLPQSNVYLNDMRVQPGDVTLALVEIGRQVGIAASHEFLDVSPEHAFVLDTMHFDVYPAMHAVDWKSSDNLWGHIVIDNEQYDGDGQLKSARACIQTHSGSKLLGTQMSHWSLIQRDRYQRLRDTGRTRAQRLRAKTDDPQPLGPGFQVKLDAKLRQPVLEPMLWMNRNASRFVATLHVDPANQFFFDHENDHIPGMLILEGMRNMALDITGKFTPEGGGMSSLQSFDVAFRNFAELDAPVQLVATLDAHHAQANAAHTLTLDIEARQFDRTVATGHFTAA